MKFYTQPGNIVLVSMMILITSKLISCQLDLDPLSAQGMILSVVFYTYRLLLTDDLPKGTHLLLMSFTTAKICKFITFEIEKFK